MTGYKSTEDTLEWLNCFYLIKKNIKKSYISDMNAIIFLNHYHKLTQPGRYNSQFIVFSGIYFIEGGDILTSIFFLSITLFQNLILIFLGWWTLKYFPNTFINIISIVKSLSLTYEIYCKNDQN